jgi:uncharacterized protein YndB with AHSA1/START domain
MNARNAAEPSSDPGARTLVITREIAAPARLVFQCYSQREHLLQWFGPKDYPLTRCEVDFRVGGKFEMAMTGPSGEQNPPFGGTYREIVPDRKIVFDNGFFGPDAERMVITVTFEERGAKTLLTMSTLFSSQAAYDEHVELGFREGTESGLDKLDALVARLQR